MHHDSFSKASYKSVAELARRGGFARFDRLDLPPPESFSCGGKEFQSIPESTLEALSRSAFAAIQFRLREDFITDIVTMAADPGADPRERIALDAVIDSLKIASEGKHPLCQDTGTACLYAWKGDAIMVTGNSGDREALERGALRAWSENRLRNSQLAPAGDGGESNTGTNAPLSCELFSEKGADYRFLFVAKGGGSSNKTALYQETKRVLEPRAFRAFLRSAIEKLGVSACPPYTIAVVIGGQSPEECLLAAKFAGSGALDALPSDPRDGGIYRDEATESLIMDLARESGWGAQFGGRFMARAARVIRLHRHAASLPIAVAVSCVAHRQALAFIDTTGVYLEHLADGDEVDAIVTRARIGAKARTGAALREVHLERLADAACDTSVGSVLKAGDMVALYGTVVLVRDAAHARLRALLEEGKSLPAWSKLPAYYASPTETPEGSALGSLGPTTAKRMDDYLDELMSRGAFLLSIGKGERTSLCAQACAKYGGWYFAAVGGAAAGGTARYVKSAKTIDWPELGMEAVREVELDGLPALVAVDNSGKDFYEGLRLKYRE